MPDTQVGPRLVGDVDSTTYIVNQDVDSVKGMLHRVDNGSRPCFCRQIAEGLAALLPLALMWLADSARARFVPTMNDDVSAFSGEPLCDRLVDGRIATRNECAFTF